MPRCLPLSHPQLNTQNYNDAAACSISLGFHRKRLIHNWVWRKTWFEVLLYCMDAAQNKCEDHVKCQVYQLMGDVYYVRND